MKALGIDAVPSFGTGTAAGQQDDAEIHPNDGYSIQAPSDIPENRQPDQPW